MGATMRSIWRMDGARAEDLPRRVASMEATATTLSIRLDRLAYEACTRSGTKIDTRFSCRRLLILRPVLPASCAASVHHVFPVS